MKTTKNLKAKKSDVYVWASNSKGRGCGFARSGKGWRDGATGRWVSLKTLNTEYDITATSAI